MVVTIRIKLLVMVAVAAAICAGLVALEISRLAAATQAQKEEVIQTQTQSALTVAQSFLGRAQSGEMTQDLAQAEAARAIAAIRYGQDDYMFIVDTDARMVAHANASLVGQSFWDTHDADGHFFFRETIRQARGGGGYSAYVWPRAGSEQAVPKLSYAQLLPEWNWVIGTGVYTDDVNLALRDALITAALSLVLSIALLLAVALPIARSITRPLSKLTDAMGHLSRDDLSREVPSTGRKDDIGAMAKAVQVFKDNAIRARALEEEAVALREAQEAERERRAAVDRQTHAELREFVDSIEGGFARLSQGDMTVRIGRAVAAQYEPIRGQFNDTVEKLESTLGSVVTSIGSIRTGLGEINVASNDLAQRTEQQAASLEETVAALAEVTRAVNETAQDAGRAQESAESANRNAAKGGEIVGKAVEAMRGIEQSSEKIGKIIGVIDEIAFQTNLLALNAGVEAARAGEAGRGFAVVAQEVRGLAQRSAEAAKEIKDLISTSSVQVEAGVELVSASGRSLDQIIAEVGDMSRTVAEIARRAREQAVSLKEVQAAADQMDKVTQQNAAMVEEATAAAQSLAAETDELGRLIAEFKLASAQGRASSSGSAAASHRPAANRTSPAQRPVMQMRPTAHGNAALKTLEDSWEEF